MRRVASLGLALCAAALAVAPVVRADEPSSKRHHRHLCPKCQMAEVMKVNGGAPVVFEGSPLPTGTSCATCQAQGGVITPMARPDGGFMVAGNEPPGYATLGTGRQFSTEPLPIGVVQANYQPQGAPAAAAGRGFDPTHGPSAPRNPHAGMGMSPYAGMGAAPGMGAMAGPRPGPVSTAPDGPARRPRVLTHLFGFESWGERRAARAARDAQAHAAIPVGQPGFSHVSEVPASAVYGRR